MPNHILKEKCERAGYTPEQINKYADDPYMLNLLWQGQLTNPAPERLTPHQQWCEDKAEFNE